MLEENRLIRSLDRGLLLAVAGLVFCGLIAIYSATLGSDSPIIRLNFMRQVFWVVVASLVLTATVMLPTRFFYEYAYPAYLICNVLLIAVIFFGIGTGTKRWIAMGPVWLQPAEFAKIGVILALAKFLSQGNRKLDDFRDLGLAFAFVFIPMVLVMRQPDLGSALVFMALFLPMLHWAGVPNSVLFVLIAPVVTFFCAFSYYSFLIAMLVISVVLLLLRRGMLFFVTNFVINIGVGILTPILWNLLKEYQKQRILTFLGLVQDPKGLGYQVIQSKVAIGSGGFLGKGFLDGTQTHLRFLPEQHTDFIFCVVGEEFGFIGALVILSLYLFVIWKGINISVNAKRKFASLLVFGGVVVILFQIMVNIGMTVGIMPVTGIPLPFLSYGGSSLLTNFILIGLMVNVSQKRFEYI
jgi:rod shape determining protein RodA